MYTKRNRRLDLFSGSVMLFAGIVQFISAADYSGAYTQAAAYGVAVMSAILGIIWLAQGLRRQAPPGDAREPRGARRIGDGLIVEPCQICFLERAVFHCKVHSLNLCHGCTVRHDKQVCVYDMTPRQEVVWR